MGLINPYNGMVIGGGNMAAAIGIVDGNAGAPGLYLNNSPTTGIYRFGANLLGFSCNGVLSLLLSQGIVSLRGASPYYEWIGTTPQTWRLGDGIADAGGVMVLYDVTSARKVMRCVPGTSQIELQTNLKVIGLVDGAALNAGTLLNSPVAGNPTFWMAVEINGLGIKYVPCW